jgi:hemerythrin-like domain-containing protein
MASSRRHKSLIPLSREHQYALLLCLRIHRGAPEHEYDFDWLQKKVVNTVQFFASDLATHFQAEEAFLFPAMKHCPNASALIAELLDEHQKLAKLIDELGEMQAASKVEAPTIAERLLAFADLLEAHIRKEERQLFPIYEENLSPEIFDKVAAGIVSLIGEALQPKRPELLQ